MKKLFVLGAIAVAALFSQTAFANIGGTVYCDANCNGIVDSGDVPLGGVTVNAYLCGTTTLVGSTVTAADGSYRFEPTTTMPVDGSFYTCVVVPTGYNGSSHSCTSDCFMFAEPCNCGHDLFICPISGTCGAPCPCPTSIAGIPWGATANGLVIGLAGTKINNSLVTINGNEYVSQGGSLVNMAPSTINGNVYEYAAGQYSGPGKLHGSINVNPALLTQIDVDALNLASGASALAPTVVLGTISSPTAITGNGGVNVIDVNGDIKNTLVLNGTANDVFVVNVTGTLTLGGNATLGVSGPVATGNVLYNFTGASGTISTHVGNVVNGTLLAPTYSFNLDGGFNGRIIGGGKSIVMMSGTLVNQPACPCN